ncbi:SRPBCC family protein [Ectothiorhodospiraceae bacterium WFHF3C12]|nr:SRPBCC family protein [Ectothiorhodospiraceae bacterium WFHF3C12]
MTDAGIAAGSIEAIGDHYEIVLRREVECDRATLWSMLTDAEHLKNWLAPGTLEPGVGGRVSLDFGVSGTAIDSRVTAWEPPAVLEYSWSSDEQPTRPLRWQLEAGQGSTDLTVTLRVPGDEDPAKTAAGWDAHLEMLLAAVAGVPIGFPVERFKASRAVFQQQLASADQANR